MQENNLIYQNIINEVDSDNQQIVSDALALLSKKPNSPKQLLLFEDLQDYNQNLDAGKLKTEKGLSFTQEAAARLLAAGVGKTKTYLLTHPGCQNKNQNSLWVRACKFCNDDKIRLRVEDIKKNNSDKALMSVTEAYKGLSDLARNAVKDEVRRASYVDILKIRGVFKEEIKLGGNIILSFDKEDENV